MGINTMTDSNAHTRQTITHLVLLIVSVKSAGVLQSYIKT